jgi:CheY-like chemotaxis protein
MAKILLVEDNEMNRDMLSRRLGYEVSIAIDGQQGADMAVSEKPDIILMDMSLPVIDGWRQRVASRPMMRRGKSR